MATPASRSAAVTVGALILLALVLRLAVVRQSLFGDEVFLFSDVHGQSLRHVLSVVEDTEKTPPLGFALGWLFARGGEPTTLVRVPSLLAGVTTVLLVYVLGTRTVGRAAALVAAAWFALSAFAVFYATENRAYALVTGLCVLSTLALVLALELDRGRWWALYAAAVAAALYTHYTAVLVLAPQAAWALWARRDLWRRQLAAVALSLLAFAPWLPAFVVQARNSADEARRISLLVPLSPANVAEAAIKGLVGHPYAPLGELPGRPALVALGAVVVAALLLAARSPARLSWRDGRGLLVVLALAPLVLVVLYSVQPHRSLLLPRNLSVGVPYVLLLLGALLTRPRGRVAAVGCAVALAAVAVGSVKVMSARFQRPDSRAAAAFIDAHAPPDALVVDVPGPQAVRVYLDPRRRVVSLADFGLAAWGAAARARAPVVFSTMRAGFFPEILRPPPQLAAPARRTADRSWPGSPGRVVVRSYAWR